MKDKNMFFINIIKKYHYIYSLLPIIGIIIIILVIVHDFINEKKINLYKLEQIIVSISLSFIIIGFILFTIYRMKKYLKKKRINTNKIEVFLVIILFVFLSYSGVLFFKELIKEPSYNTWSIGVYFNNEISSFNLYNKSIINPVITKDMVNDIEAGFVADPFLIKNNEIYYIFFEVYNVKTRQGDISFAYSNNTIDWMYGGIILDLDMHLSYPQVFLWKEEYYMIPEYGESNSVILFKSLSFPWKWEQDTILLKGSAYKDSTIFHYNNTWFMFTSSTGATILRLFYSDDLRGPWIEHPLSPIRKNDPNFSRPGGRIIQNNETLIRIAQDNYPDYGKQLYAFNIKNINKTHYVEEILTDYPIFEPFEKWNSQGVHHLDVLKLKDDEYLICIDGKS